MIIVKIMNKIVIFGSGGHAKVILSEIIKLKKFKACVFISSFDSSSNSKSINPDSSAASVMNTLSRVEPSNLLSLLLPELVVQ